jgi:hypothetical protein
VKSRLSAPATAARALGVAILAELGALHLVLRADAERAFLFGYELPSLCALRETLGLPCPTCGVTRAVGLTLHGELGAAWQLFPAVPVTLGWLAALAVALLFVDGRRPGAGVEGGLLRLRLTRAALGFSGLSLVVWLVDYAARV